MIRIVSLIWLMTIFAACMSPAITKRQVVVIPADRNIVFTNGYYLVPPAVMLDILTELEHKRFAIEKR